MCCLIDFRCNAGVIQICNTAVVRIKYSGRRLQYLTGGTYFSTAVFQQDVDVLLVLKVVIKVHNVFMVQYSVQLNFSVNLAGGRDKTVN